MILRKPYAFLIKHFKLMHVILSACIFYLIFKTGAMISYLNEYIGSNISVVGDDILGELYNIGVLLLPLLIIIFSAVLLAVMITKSKPRFFYIAIIIVYIAILAIYIYGYSVFATMEKTIVDMRTIKMLRDLLVYSMIAQSIFSIFAVVRGVGFDIKKFNFGNDLQELEISLEDNEEFEVAIDFDLNDKTRAGKKMIRYSKYWIKEHKLIVKIVSGIFVVSLVIYAGLSYILGNKTYPEGYKMTMNGFNMTVLDSYIVNTDPKGKNITGENAYLVVVKVEINCNETKPKALNLGTIALNIAGERYYHTSRYDYQLVDFGNIYNDQQIGENTEKYLLVFEIPSNSVSSKMRLEFRNLASEKTTPISLDSELISDIKKYKEYQLGATIDFSDSTLGNSTLKINSFEFRNTFEVKYNYCTPRKRCIESVEYIKPNLFTSNYNKALLKLDAEFSLDKSFDSDAITDLYGLFKVFATIEYRIGNDFKQQTVYLGDVKSKKVNQKNIYYIEVIQEMKIADQVTLIFNIRDRVYKYKLK